MESSPFPHQGPLAAEQVRGREDLIADLLERATSRRVTALLGPRRFGKTSVLRKVEALLDQASVGVIWIDLYAVRSTADLVVRIDEGLANTGGNAGRHLRSVATSASVNLGMFKLEFSKPAAQRPDPDGSLHIVLDVLVKAALAGPTVVVIDEFTGLNAVEGAAGLLRTKLQHHVQDIGLLFAGSEPTAMAAMFSDMHQPFYAQADLVEIKPFSAAEWNQIVEAGFASTGDEAGNLAAHIHQFTGGHPYRSMQLADSVWRSVHLDGTPAAEAWGEGLQQVRASTGPTIEMLFSSFTGAEQSVLRALAGNRPMFGGSLDLFGSSSGGVAAARDRLVANGTLDRDQAIVDPLLADWIRTRFAL
ncbi:MAG: hypothetical protein ACN4GZ_03865 [Acidimicrobiales bacterium]